MYHFFAADNYYCRETVLDAMDAIEEIMHQANGGQTLQELFNLCHPVATADPTQITFFYDALVDFIQDYIRQYQ